MVSKGELLQLAYTRLNQAAAARGCGRGAAGGGSGGIGREGRPRGGRRPHLVISPLPRRPLPRGPSSSGVPVRVRSACCRIGGWLSDERRRRREAVTAMYLS